LIGLAVALSPTSIAMPEQDDDAALVVLK